MKRLVDLFNRIIKKHKELKRWKRIVTVLAALITFVTTYALILPAITVERNKTEEVGGMYLEQEKSRDDMLLDYALEPDGEDILKDKTLIDPAEPNEEAAPAVKTLKASGYDYTVTLTCDETSGIPEEAYLTASEIAEDSEEYQIYLNETKKAMGLAEQETLPHFAARFFDIKIMVGDEEIQPESGVSVEITYAEPLAENPETEVSAVHFADEATEPEMIEANTTEVRDSGAATVEFTAESFSVYGVIYTVDFHWEVNGKMYQFSLPGGRFVSFTDLIEVLDILGDTYSDNNGDEKTAVSTGKAQGDVANEGTEENSVNSDTNTPLTLGEVEVSDATRKFVADVVAVEFSSPELLWVGKADSEITVGALKEANDLNIQYSAELTEEQIAEIDAQTVETGDWAMISMLPFSSEEELTVTMKTGEVFTIKVTDYQISTNVLTADGKNYKITVTFDDEAEIPVGTKLIASEIEFGSDEYLKHLGQAWTEINKKYLEQEEKKNNNGGLDEYEDIRPVNLDDARFFRISLIYNKKEIEPKAPVQVDILFVDGLETSVTAEEAVIGAAHFIDNSENTDAEDGAVELIPTVDTVCDEDGKYVEFTYEQDGFSDIGTYVGQKTYDNVPYKMSQALALPLLRALSNSTKNGNQLKDIEAHKKLTNNNDGTYTMSLTVKGDSVANEEYNKANILFVMDRSSSMTNSSNDIYTLYTGEYQAGTTYYGKNGNSYFALSYNNGIYGTWGWGGYYEYAGDIYTRQSRLAAEQAAMDVLIQNLLAKNDPNTPGKADLIEISVISFAKARCSGDTEYTNWTSSDYDGLMDAINQTNTPAGTNWEDALIYAQEVAAAKKAAQPNEDVYVIFLTDGEPTAVYGETGGAYHYISGSTGQLLEGGFEYALTETGGGGPYNSHGRIEDGKNALDRAKALVDDPNNFKFYGIFTFNPGEAQTRYLRRLMNYAYTGVDKAYEDEATKTDTDIVKKYFTNADTPETLTGAFEKIFADVSSTLGYGDVVITDGLQSADAMTTTIHADKADGFRYSLTDDTTGNELYYVTATGDDTNPTVIFHIGDNDYPAGASKEGVDEKPYYSVKVNGTEYKMALADLNGRELKWDLSALGALVPDCTYKVDIIVWPNQDAYDYVAGLNNHLPGYTWDPTVESDPDKYYEVTINEETYGYYTGGVEDYPSIVKYADKDVYSVLTNTHQELNYSIVNTKTNEVTGETTMTSDPQDPLPLEPQKPMDLVKTSSQLAKQWNTNRDKSILYYMLYEPKNEDGEIELPFDITFEIYQGSVLYRTVHLPGCWDEELQDYDWSKIDPDWGEDGSDSPYMEEYKGKRFSTRWLEGFSIASGLMLSETRMNALGLDTSETSPYPSGLYPADGDTPTRYWILETGHEYTIKEIGKGFEFDFVPPKYHPMLVDGVLQNVIFTTEEKTATFTSMEVMTYEDEKSSLNAVNTLRGYIYLNKVVTDKDNVTVASDNTKFEYEVNLVNPADVFIGNDIPWYGVSYGNSEDRVELYYHDEEFNYYQADAKDNNLKITTEDNVVHPAVFKGYYDDEDVYHEGGTFDESRITGQTLTYSDDAGEHTVTIYGNRMGCPDAKHVSATLKITQNETLSIANVPVDTTYNITEINNPRGYVFAGITYENTTVKSINGTTINGEIVQDSANRIVYTNKALIGDLKLKKQVTINDFDPSNEAVTDKTLADGVYEINITGKADTATAGKSYTVKITINDGEAASATIRDNTVETPVNTPVSLVNGAVSLEDLTPGIYTVTESSDDDTGLIALNSTNASDTVDLENRKIEVIVGPGTSNVSLITFINNYADNSATDIAHVSVRKTFKGITADQIPGGFKVKVKVTYNVKENGTTVQKVENYELTGASDTTKGIFWNQTTDGDGNIVWNWTIAIRGLNPDAQVEVEEVGYTKPGYEVTPSVNPADPSESGTSYTGTVSASTTVASVVPTVIVAQNTLTFNLNDLGGSATVFIARIVPSQTSLVISKNKLNLSERAALEEQLKHMPNAQNWYNNTTPLYYSFEEAANNQIVVRNQSTVTYSETLPGDPSTGQIVFSKKCQWNMVGTALITYQEGRPADFNFVNEYSELDVGIDIVKVDIKNRTTKLPGAEFTITMLEETSKPGHISYKMKPNTDPAEYELQQVSAATGTDGSTGFSGLKSGYYEIKETKFPAGYFDTGESTFYVKIADGVASYLAVSADETKEITEWETITSTSNTDLIQVTNGTTDNPTTTGIDETTNTQFSIGNTPGVALPNTGGPGTRLFTILGSILILGAGVLLWRRRRLI